MNFTSIAQNYSDHRPRYSAELIDDLRELTVGERADYLVDWGAGTGELAIPLSPRFERVVAIDAHPGMVSVGRVNARNEGAEHIEWHIGRAENFEVEPESCDLIVSGSAFHWMDRQLLGRRAFEGLTPGSALALVAGGGRDVWKGSSEWHELAVVCLKKHVENPGVRKVRKHDLTKAHADFLVPLGFELEDRRYSTVHSMGPDDVIGYLYSISFALPGRLGDRRELFETELRELLTRANPSGVFQEQFDFRLTIARKPST